MPGLSGDTPLELCLAEAQEAGYDGIELGNQVLRQRTAAPLSGATPLRLLSGWHGSRLLERPVEDELRALASHSSRLLGMG